MQIYIDTCNIVLLLPRIDTSGYIYFLNTYITVSVNIMLN